MLVDSTASIGRSVAVAAQKGAASAIATPPAMDSGAQSSGAPQLSAVRGLNPLAPTSAFHAMEQAQAGAQSAVSLSAPSYDEMREVVTNSDYGNQVAQEMSEAPHSAVSADHLFDPAYQADQATVDSIQPQLSALYDSDKAAGKTGAQTVGDILKFELSQSQSFWNSVDPDHLQSGDAKGYAQAELDTLQAQMQASGTSKQG